MKKEKSIEHIRKACGGGEESDFKKHPPTEGEIYECVKRLGCVSLEEIAFHRRKIVIRR